MRAATWFILAVILASVASVYWAPEAYTVGTPDDEVVAGVDS